jgi:hypothetical protein
MLKPKKRERGNEKENLLERKNDVWLKNDGGKKRNEKPSASKNWNCMKREGKPAREGRVEVGQDRGQVLVGGHPEGQGLEKEREKGKGKFFNCI